MNQTLYEVLGVKPSASADEIKAAYREQAMRWHPDKNNGNKAAEERFKAISHAYSIVGNAEARQTYDAQMAAGIHTEQAFQSGPSTQEAAAMFFTAMLSLAFELTARNVALSEIARELMLRGCPDAVAYEIASRVEAERKRGIRSVAGALLRRSLLWILGGGALFTIFGDVGVIRAVGALMIVRGVWAASRAIYRVSTGRVPLDRETARQTRVWRRSRRRQHESAGTVGSGDPDRGGDTASTQPTDTSKGARRREGQSQSAETIPKAHDGETPGFLVVVVASLTLLLVVLLVVRTWDRAEDPARAPQPPASSSERSFHDVTPVRALIGNTDGVGVRSRSDCRQESGSGGIREGTQIIVLGNGIDHCRGWLVVEDGDERTWVREEYIIGAEPSVTLDPRTLYVGNTGGVGVRSRSECDNEVGKGGIADGSSFVVVAAGTDACTGWLLGTTDTGRTSWIRARYLIDSLSTVDTDSSPTGTTSAAAATELESPEVSQEPPQIGYGPSEASDTFSLGSLQDEVIRVQGRPDQIDSYSALGYETWEYGRSTIDIGASGRRVLSWNNEGNLKITMRPGSNITQGASYTRGSHQDDVLRLQGTPDEINVYSASGYETWEYGRSTIDIGASGRRVLSWNNEGNLKITMRPGSNITQGASYTRGSHQDDVLRLQGTPDEINVYSASGYETWEYGRSTIDIGASGRRVLSWNNEGNLKITMRPGSNITQGASYTRGSHQDDVLRLQGTPDEINVYSASGYETWEYGRSTIDIGASGRRVLSWNNEGNLKITMRPGSNITQGASYTRGSHQDDVLRLQGTPDEINVYSASGYETWEYGRSTIDIEIRGRTVVDWDNKGNLKVVKGRVSYV